jgi:hypothetical protein
LTADLKGILLLLFCFLTFYLINNKTEKVFYENKIFELFKFVDFSFGDCSLVDDYLKN